MSIMQNVWSEGLKIFFNEKATLMKKDQLFRMQSFVYHKITDFKSTMKSVESVKKIQNSTYYVAPMNNIHMAS